MILRLTNFWTLAFLFIASPVCSFAQPHARKEFYEGMREAFFELPHREMLDLLEHPPVREELGVSEEDVAKISEAKTEVMHAVTRLQNEIGRENWSSNDFREKIVAELEPIGDKHFKLIEEKYGPETLKRLVGLFAKWRGESSVGNREVAKRIGMSDSELERFRKERRKAWEDSRDEIRREIRKILENQESNVGEKMARLYREQEMKRNSRLASLLTDSQKEEFRKLQDTDFSDWPERWRRPPSNREHTPPRQRDPKDPRKGSRPDC